MLNKHGASIPDEFEFCCPRHDEVSQRTERTPSEWQVLFLGRGGRRVPVGKSRRKARWRGRRREYRLSTEGGGGWRVASVIGTGSQHRSGAVVGHSPSELDPAADHAQHVAASGGLWPRLRQHCRGGRLDDGGVWAGTAIHGAATRVAERVRLQLPLMLFVLMLPWQRLLVLMFGKGVQLLHLRQDRLPGDEGAVRRGGSAEALRGRAQAGPAVAQLRASAAAPWHLGRADGDGHAADGATAEGRLAGGLATDGGHVRGPRQWLGVRQQADSRGRPFGLEHAAVVQAQVAVPGDGGGLIEVGLVVSLLPTVEGDVVVIWESERARERDIVTPSTFTSRHNQSCHGSPERLEPAGLSTEGGALSYFRLSCSQA